MWSRYHPLLRVGGFAYGLLDVLNSHFQTELHITTTQASGLSAAYFGPYFLCLFILTITGRILRRYGFRVTFMTGSAVLAVACSMFWPRGAKRSFGGFCGSMFNVGAGLSTLETGADSFLSICGPPRYSEVRLNLAQSIQGVGSFVAPLLASRVYFASTVDTAQGLKNVQWVYLGVACFVALLIILFWAVSMPEVTDADMAAQEVQMDFDPGPLRKQAKLFLDVWSQLCYVGAQVAVANYFIKFCRESGRDSATSSNLLAVGQGMCALNRFLADDTRYDFGRNAHPRALLRIRLVRGDFHTSPLQSRKTHKVGMIIPRRGDLGRSCVPTNGWR
ncbi:hypothetical protein G7K_2308-t1 [Saitoella complicata NRRL Y-17804]|uniref:Major facilitator superfamily (MFS) profile domain-containing protein n=1 Tax=Saitoella complicata (strain BCRC 22490 / CBS 7301 / JCM 7358 / NBRC 10748 / NRRL Y-17804) TaxID=698492 RepID=A0A0E9NE49_SAICN|nr:hypothetical protein G7K_2308-t1 [Saitoella complicata NRRL Y-17804]